MCTHARAHTHTHTHTHTHIYYRCMNKNIIDIFFILSPNLVNNRYMVNKIFRQHYDI